MGSNDKRQANSAWRWRRLAAAGAPVVLVLSGSDAGGATLYSQNFDALTLQPFVSPTEGGGSGSDWSSDLPAGWVRDNTTTPEGGPAEFFGFSFLAKDSWIATEVNQERSTFARGTGVVMVADPDAYDDGAVDIDPNQFNVFMRTGPISLTNVAPGSARLTFDSSFRPYDTMTGSVEVSFDDGASFRNLLTLNKDNSGGDSSLDRANEAVDLALDNPAGATSAIVRFGMTEAGNDWWWAVDNVAVTGDIVPEPGGALFALAAAGMAALRRRKR